MSSLYSISKDRNINNHHLENLKSKTLRSFQFSAEIWRAIYSKVSKCLKLHVNKARVFPFSKHYGMKTHRSGVESPCILNLSFWGKWEVSFMLHFQIYILLTDHLFSSGFSSTDCMALDSRLINEWWVTKDVERGSLFLIWGSILAFAWRDWGKTWKTSAGVVSVLAENQTSHLPKSGSNYYCLSQFAQSFTHWVET